MTKKKENNSPVSISSITEKANSLIKKVDELSGGHPALAELIYREARSRIDMSNTLKRINECLKTV